jgi:hypothetical protein
MNHFVLQQVSNLRAEILVAEDNVVNQMLIKVLLQVFTRA